MYSIAMIGEDIGEQQNIINCFKLCKNCSFIIFGKQIFIQGKWIYIVKCQLSNGKLKIKKILEHCIHVHYIVIVKLKNIIILIYNV